MEEVYVIFVGSCRYVMHSRSKRISFLLLLHGCVEFSAPVGFLERSLREYLSSSSRSSGLDSDDLNSTAEDAPFDMESAMRLAAAAAVRASAEALSSGPNMSGYPVMNVLNSSKKDTMDGSSGYGKSGSNVDGPSVPGTGLSPLETISLSNFMEVGGWLLFSFLPKSDPSSEKQL